MHQDTARGASLAKGFPGDGINPLARAPARSLIHGASVPSSQSTPAGNPLASQSPFACAACGGGDIRTFYQVKDVPAHSCLMLSSREEALAFPRGDIELGFCGGCGFIGSALVLHLVQELGHEVVTLDALTYAANPSP